MPSVWIRKVGINGEGIGFDASTPILVYGALPDDHVEYSVISQNKQYIRGKLVRILNENPARRKPLCRLCGLCEGCPLMPARYENQLSWKREELCTDLAKYANVDEALVDEVVGCEPENGYRNLIKLPVFQTPKGLACGIYRRESNHPVFIHDCLVHEPELEKRRKEVLKVLNRYQVQAYNRKTHTGLRYLYLRGLQGKYQLALVGGKEKYAPQLVDDLMKIPGMNSIYQNIQTAHDPIEILGHTMIHLAGTKALSFRLDSVHLCLSLPSFFQENTRQATKMYETAVSLVPDHVHNLVEAYCGIGAMSLLAKDKADQVTGIEYAASSIRDAKEALKRNQASNVQFIQGDAARELTRISKNGHVDCLIADPPRTGLDDAMIATIEQSRIDTIIYISCNPYTLAKNIASLTHYHVQDVIPFDFFCETPHVETVALLIRQN